MLVSYLSLAITSKYGSGILLLPIAALIYMPLGEWLGTRYAFYRVAIQGVTMLYVASLPVFFRFTGLVQSVVALVIYIQLYSLVHVKTSKNYNHIVLMSFFLLLAACVGTPPPEIAVVFLLFLAATVTMLIELERMVARKVPLTGAPSSPSQPFREKHSRAKGRVRAYSPFRVLAISSVLAVMTGILFVAGPRTEAGLFGAMDEAQSYTTGVSSRVDLSRLGPISRNTAPVMRVQFPEEPEGQYDGELLWRMAAMDDYTGSGWQRSDSERGRNRRGRGRSWISGRSSAQILPTWVVQDIYYDKSPKDGVPHLPRARTIESKDTRSSTQLSVNRWDEIAIASSRINEVGIRYTVTSDTDRASAEELRSASEDYGDRINFDQWQILTSHNLMPETAALLDDITQGADTVYDKVVAVEGWLSDGDFIYTLNVPNLPPDHPVDAFIRETKAGHCQLYASAMALMVRSLDIPARVVSGYRGGRWQEDDRSYIIDESMAHLWVEVFFPGYGWVTFDPSPVAPEISSFGLSDIARAASMLAMKARLIWLQNVVGYNPGNTFESLRNSSFSFFGLDLRPRSANESATLVMQRPNFFRTVSYAFVLIVAVAVLYFLLRPLVPARTASSIALSADQLRAVRLYQTIARKLREIGLDPKGKTVEEILPQLGDSLGMHTPTMTNALTAYNDVRFGRRPLSKNALSELRKGVLALRKGAVGDA